MKMTIPFSVEQVLSIAIGAGIEFRTCAEFANNTRWYVESHRFGSILLDQMKNYKQQRQREGERERKE